MVENRDSRIVKLQAVSQYIAIVMSESQHFEDVMLLYFCLFMIKPQELMY